MSTLDESTPFTTVEKLGCYHNNSYQGKPPFSYGFPMVFPWFSYCFQWRRSTLVFLNQAIKITVNQRAPIYPQIFGNYIYTYILVYLIIYDYIWLYMITYDFIWFYMIIWLYYYIWLFMIIYDYIWLYIYIYDYLLLYMIIFDYIW